MTKEDYKLGHHKENKTWQTPADLLTKKTKMQTHAPNLDKSVRD
jgi:hypothetical protein